MIIVDRALERRAAEGRPIRIGMIGAGFQASGLARHILNDLPGLRLDIVCNRRLDPARRCFTQSGIEPVTTTSAATRDGALRRGDAVVTDDPALVTGCPELDVVVEVTGSLDYAAGVVLDAIRHGKHVVHMNAELDATVGPILKCYADEAGVVYTFSDGDQPGVQMNLFRFVKGLGVTPRLCGNIKGLHDPYRNPETQAAFAAKWKQKPHMVASFADGTKISFEQAIVANGTGFRVARRGMLGPDFSGGDPTAPLTPLADCVAPFADALDATEGGLVDYVVGASPGPGVFVIGTHDDPVQQHYLNLYKLGAGPYYLFTAPYHLCHFEIPNSIVRAVDFQDPVLAPDFGPMVGVTAFAKKDLSPGETVELLGGFEAYGVCENQGVIRAEGLVPIGLALGATVKRPIAQDTPLRWDDLVFPAGRFVDRLYQEQEAHFAPQEMAS